ncbi:MAG: 16S rRNA (guanine(527)-N(7))-methyltransferase RsmG [Cyanobacteria bacterium]|nr:16S rRNA (guanine(527)-N(7))-methyltransferase RsmG [Cyanobacteriota bacterium]MDA1020549.1 16S rRNA (guanine(527)-N(7))-methyltransferase RsmG [Cyanobacteriota bacterium]
MQNYPQHSDQFTKLYELYTDYNSHTNISAIKDKAEVYQKHFEDSLSIVPFLENTEANVIDVGTGGGFPALPLAIVLPQITITAIDGTGKKIRFVELAKEELELTNLTAITARAEELAHDQNHREQYDMAISRAVAELRILLEYTCAFVKPNGFIIAFKKQGIEEEIAMAQAAMHELSLKLIQQIDQGDKQLLVFKKTAKTTALYPRSNKEIKNKTL